MIRILVDADLILEALINRIEFGKDIRELLDTVHPLIQIYLTDVGWQKIYAYTSRLRNHQIAEIVLNWLKQKVKICRIDQHILQKARCSNLKDFESAVELVCVNYQKLNAIVTHKPEDFQDSNLSCWIWSIGDLWIRVHLETQLQTSKGK